MSRSRPRTVHSLLDYGVERFEQAGISYGHGTTNAFDEAAWLVLHALGHPPHDLQSHLDDPVDEAHWKKAIALLDRRVKTRKPAAYLIHEAWLGPHRFYVDERVIVPRSFIAELLLPKTGDGPGFFAEEAAKRPKGKTGSVPGFRVLDLCTGSGCLAILAALAFPDAQVDAADLSQDALAVARRNVTDYALGDRIGLVKSDLFSNLRGRKYDLILSNPPYVTAASMRRLSEEFRREPQMALASGVDGLDHTRRILAQARSYLRPNARLVVEMGRNRKALERAFPGLAFEWPKTSAGRGYVFAISREML